jgi:ribonuclease-3
MNNPFNKLITKNDVEKILNYYINIGNERNGTREFLNVNDIEKYQLAFVHESYYMSCVKNVLHKSDTQLDKIYINWVPNSSNERLEFLGDSILKSVLGKYIYFRFKEEREGYLTKIKTKLEKSSSLYIFAKNLNFKKWLLLSTQVENETLLDFSRGRNTPKFYEDAFEAFIGAIIEDFPDEKGYIYAERFIISVIENNIDFTELLLIDDNYKDTLQKFFHSQKWKTPEYNLLWEYTSLFNQKIFIKGVFIKIEYFTEYCKTNKKNFEKIKNYTNNLIEHFYKNNWTNTDNTNSLYQNLIHKIYGTNELSTEPLYFILGIGQGNNINITEQNCAKNVLENLNKN